MYYYCIVLLYNVAVLCCCIVLLYVVAVYYLCVFILHYIFVYCCCISLLYTVILYFCCSVLLYIVSGNHKKTKLPNFGHCQTFYRKKVWTCFKGGGGSKGRVQSSFFVKKFVLGSLKSFSVLKLSTFYMLINMNFNIK